VVAFGGGEGLPGSREIAGDGVREIRRPRSEIRTRSGQGVTWLHGYIVTWGRGSGGIEAEAEEEGVGDGAIERTMRASLPTRSNACESGWGGGWLRRNGI